MIDVASQKVDAADRVDEQQEFVAADARQHVGLADLARNAARDLDEQPVADGVAVIIVDVLEIIGGDEGQREAAALAPIRDEPFALLCDPPAIGQRVELAEITTT